MISKKELRILLEDAFKDFLQQYSSVNDNEVLKTIRVNKNSLLDSMSEIFYDSSLREKWNKLTPQEMIDFPLPKILSSLLSLNELSDVFTPIRWEPQKGKKWFEYLTGASRVISRPEGIEDLKAHWDFFQDQKLPRSYPKELKKDLMI